MRYRYVLPFLFLFFVNLVFAEDVYTLKELLNIALSRADVINITKEESLISKYTKSKELSLLVPDFSLYAGHRRYTDEKKSTMVVNLPRIGEALPQELQEYLPRIDVVSQPESASNWGARVDQKYSLGGKEFIGISIANEGIKRSKYEIERVSEDYLMQVANAYFNVLLAKRGVQIAESNRERLKTHRNASEKRYLVGKDTKTVLLRAEAELSGSASEVVRSKNNFDYAKVFLARLVGIFPNFSVEEVDIVEPSKIDLNYLLSEAYKNRPEIKQAELDKTIFDKQINYAKSSYFPDLGLEGVYSNSDTDPGHTAQDIESIYFGLTLTLPVFEGGFRKADVAQARSQRRQATFAYFDAKKTVSVEVNSAILDLDTERNSLKSYNDQLVYAQDNYKMVSRQFDVGLASSVDFIDANTLLLTTERQVSEAFYNYQLSILKLNKAVGKLLDYFGFENRKVSNK